VIILFASYVTVHGQPSIPEGRLNFKLPDLNGNIVYSTDSMFIGKVIMVTLWATWCPPCISEIPTFNDLQEQYRESGLVVVAIAFETKEEDNQRQEQLRGFVTKHNINYLVLDGGTPDNLERSVPSVKNVSGLPVEILINRDGSAKAYCRRTIILVTRLSGTQPSYRNSKAVRNSSKDGQALPDRVRTLTPSHEMVSR
jgi:thiol-disulfide isomerase/thioredoxin